ncbi:nucleoside/nucleotide kinase family protein [Actinacidiphila bryophytorum]|uniref:Pantothenate kinase n=1 Tax=Actinacidiphila bryophytorum TaxID=1436133 RepID=A0A9W4GZG9_9ACTN|nr:nucleoside/nucleotide kinase family protein [Actinacidiphila bryophytorum]MBM9434718.1 nucleoside/nucleotide kinase family protein [Actinacidiphila bryophytorum]MBN6543828.1 nucleoside/nucleotide kinase family protein [Actinacidiphila bryophytorum]CAG7629268.1 Pantothenate kinase [Actinacidiphila bryophytorum]
MLVDDAVALVPSIPGRRALLGLAGAPAAGKSTLARRLVAGVNDRLGAGTAAYVPMDGFHLSNAQLDRLRLRDRKGAPETFDVDGYVALLGRLRSERTRPVYAPDFDRRLDEPVAAGLVVPAGTALVVTEGNYLADDGPGWGQVRDLLDELWYVETPRRLRERRLLRRHVRGGRTEAEARAFIASSERLNARRVELTRPFCTRVVSPRDP